MAPAPVSRASTRLVLPAPPCPTRAMVRISSVLYLGMSSSSFLSHGFRYSIDFFRIQYLIVALEKLSDARAMHFELERSQADRADHFLAVPLGVFIHHIHTFQSQRWSGV